LSSGSWLSAAVLARLKGQAPSAQADALILDNGVGQQQQSVSQQSGHNEDVPAVGDDDPNNNPDPDDLCSMEIDPPPQQSENWWSALVFSSEGAPVNPLDARIAIQHVAYRLRF
jgi:hypothetical protein